MPNHGQRVLVVKPPSGRLMSLASQVVPCTGSPTAVAKLIDASHFVGFHKNGSFIMDLETGEFDKMTRVNDCFELVLEVLPHTEAEPLLKA